MGRLRQLFQRAHVARYVVYVHGHRSGKHYLTRTGAGEPFFYQRSIESAERFTMDVALMIVSHFERIQTVAGFEAIDA